MARSPVLFNIQPADDGTNIVGRIDIEVRKRDDSIAYLCRTEGLTIRDLRTAIDTVAHAAKAL
jgi:hypothetical protein